MVAAMIARPVRTIIVVVLVVAVVGGAWLWSRADSSTPVSEEAALQTLREAGGTRMRAGPAFPRRGSTRIARTARSAAAPGR